MNKDSKILVTGGAGFIGSSLLRLLFKLGYSQLYSLDNYSSGNENNHIHGVNYFKGNTKDINLFFGQREEKEGKVIPDIVFHFGEYSRINASWNEIDKVMESNLWGTYRIIDYCHRNRCKLIYSASSAILGETGKEQNFTPYTWTKAKMVELIKNFHDWFNLQFNIVYFYNVFGPGQISDGNYATLIGIFEKAIENNEKLPIVLPGTQTRIFTHIDDIVEGILLTVKKFSNSDVPIGAKDQISISEVASLFIFGKKTIDTEEESKKFTDKVKYLPIRKGDREKSSQFLKDILREECKWDTTKNIIEYIQNFVEKKY